MEEPFKRSVYLILIYFICVFNAKGKNYKLTGFLASWADTKQQSLNSAAGRGIFTVMAVNHRSTFAWRIAYSSCVKTCSCDFLFRSSATNLWKSRFSATVNNAGTQVPTVVFPERKNLSESSPEINDSSHHLRENKRQLTAEEKSFVRFSFRTSARLFLLFKFIICLFPINTIRWYRCTIASYRRKAWICHWHL